MERLIREGHVDAVIDLTTTEVADELFKGMLAAGPARLEAGAQMGIPMVVSVGTCDMANFGPKDSVPEKHGGRKICEHSPAVTLLRTNKEENFEIERSVADKLSTNVKRSELTRVLLPWRGVSMIDEEEQSFHDPEANEELFKTLEEGLKGSKTQMTSFDHDINDEAFARVAVNSIMAN
jgi:uncharacterized protein (UPF0261 family)